MTAGTANKPPTIKRQYVADTAGQKDSLENLTQQSAAWLLGIDTKALRDAHPPARNRKTGTYNGPELVAWWMARAVEKATPDPIDTENLSPRHRVELARAVKLEIEAEILKAKFIPTADVTNEFMAMAAAVRSELEAIPAAIKNDLPEPVRESVGRELRNMIRQALRRLANKGSAFTGGTE